MSDKCGAIGALIVGGRVVGQVKCDLPVGHDEHAIVRIGHEIPGDFRTPGDWATSIDRHYPPSPHAMTMTWNPEEDVDMDLFDLDEHFDVEIPVEPEPGECGKRHAWIGGGEWHKATCSLPAGHRGPHVDATEPYAGQW